jgi:translocation and assembly module TamA
LRSGVAALALAALGGLAWADTPVAISGVGNGLRNDIEAILPDRDAPLTVFDSERLALEAADRARAFLRSEGYYAAIVDTEVDEDPPLPRLVIEAGPQFSLRPPQLAFTDDPPAPEAVRAAQEALARLETGAPARAGDVLAAEAAAIAALRANGYPDAEAGDRRIVVDHAITAMLATFTLRPGPRVRLGDVVLAEADDPLRPSYVEKLDGWERGDFYSPDAVGDVRRSLASTGAFSIVTADLADEAGADGLRDVVLDIEPAEPRVLELGAGWSSTEGAGVEAEWTRRNITRRADTLTIEIGRASCRERVYTSV